MTEGRIYNTETLGAVDGPGLRFVLFMQGCNLRCKYCHNPESWSISGGNVVTVSEIFAEIRKYKNFFESSGGGITVSGGEPVLQSEFVTELFKLCRKENINTALDTSGHYRDDIPVELLKYTDLVLLDIKSIDSRVHREITGSDIDKTLEFARYLSSIKMNTWIRYVLLPGINDSDETITELCSFINDLGIVELVELLPFHKMGERKWHEMNIKYELTDLSIPEPELVDHVKEVISGCGIKVK